MTYAILHSATGKGNKATYFMKSYTLPGGYSMPKFVSAGDPKAKLFTSKADAQKVADSLNLPNCRAVLWIF